MPSDSMQDSSQKPIQCPECGAPSPGNDVWCDECGAPLASTPSTSTAPHNSSTPLNATTTPSAQDIIVEKGNLEPHSPSQDNPPTNSTRYTRSMYGCPFDEGDILHVTINNRPARIRLVSLAFSTQLASGFFAQDILISQDLSEPSESFVDSEPSVTNSTFFVEVYNAKQAPTDKLTDEQARLFRFAVGQGTYHNKPFRIFDESDSRSLESFLEQAKGLLPLDDVVALFRAVLDLTIAAHEQESLIFGISPWTVRILNQQPSEFENRTSSGNINSLCDSSNSPNQPPDPNLDPSSSYNPAEHISPPDPEITEIGDQITKEANTSSPTESQPTDLSFSADDPTLHDLSDDEILANTDIYDEFLMEHLVSVSDIVDSEFEDSIAFEQQSLEDYSIISHAHDGELTFELERSSALYFAAADDNDSPFALPKVDSTPSDVHYRAILDGLESLYPMAVQPESVPLISGFAAAEFLLGISQMIGPQADIFSLGALLFYLVTGRVPPNSIHTQYVPAVPMRNFRPNFPPGLEAVVGRAIRVEPDRRYESVRHMRNDFEHAVGQIRQRLNDSSSPHSYSVVRAAVDRHVGIAKGKRNPINQDNVFCGVEETGRLAVVVVADGVTTANYGRGDIASSYITEAAEQCWKKVQNDYIETGLFDPKDTIQTILSQANQSLVDYVNEHCLPFSGQLHEVMGSTVLIACVQDGHVTLASLGDSRAYLCTDLGLEQLTVDHNLWTLNVLDDVLPIDRAKSMPFADALARCVGSFRVAKQRLEVLPPEPDIQEFFLRSGDRLLLATDGLTDFVGINREDIEDTIHAVLRREDDPALAALELILEANRGGGGDNIGVGIIDFH